MTNPDSLFQVVITGDSIAPEARNLLSEKCRLDFSGPYPQPEALAQRLAGVKADALIVRTGKIPREVIKASPRLKVIAKHGIGVDTIDVKAASELKIPVLVASSANFQSVAEHTLALMFCLAKDIPWLDSRIRQGFWDKTKYRGVELFQKTLGLIGFGRIGRRVCELAAPLQMEILVYDPFIPVIPEEKSFEGVSRVEQLETLLKKADIVSLHCPLTEQTRHLIGQKELGTMKKTAWLINTARGDVVDQEALVRALKDGKIAAAAIDTFAPEPPQDLGLLCNAGKVVLTPHIAAATEESFNRMGVEAAKNVLTILQGEIPEGDRVVNPEVLGRQK